MCMTTCLIYTFLNLVIINITLEQAFESYYKCKCLKAYPIYNFIVYPLENTQTLLLFHYKNSELLIPLN